MTTLLLDTHVVVWAIHDPSQLSTPARDAIGDPEHDLKVSAASSWELATKHRLGRLPGGDVVVDPLPVHLRRLGAEAVPISLETSILAGSLEWGHRDPCDRILAAQAIREGWVLVTRDPAFDTLPSVRTAW